ncbi:MAG: hypothetical protein BMS9Abin34_337 [Patescibacteria group bacterium]|nr:MAG: hypothetical protein BMS9Abin34_337 [Patescibacteria group bacterium]
MVTIPYNLQSEFADDFVVCSACGQPNEIGALDEQDRCITCTELAEGRDEDEGEDEEGWQTFTGPDALKNALTAWCKANDFPIPPGS